MLCLITVSATSKAQNISFLSDYLGNVSIFDNAKIRQIEHLPLKTYKISNKSMAYEDNSRTFKIYYDNYVHTITNSIDNYDVTNNYIAFSYNNILRLFDNGKLVSLSNSITNYYLGEDLIIWFDYSQQKLKAYQNRNFFDLDDAIASENNKNNVIIGKNIATFIDSKNYLNIFYNSEVISIDYVDRIKSVSVGKNIVAFVDKSLNIFQVYYKGNFVELENFEPKSFKAGDDFLIYVDASSSLKYYSDNSTVIVSFDEPDFYEVADKMVVFGVQNFFRVYLNGQVYTLENYIPKKYLFKNNVICYIDELGNLKYFDGNKTETISYETITEFELHGNIVKYKYGVSSENIYFNGKTYTN